jgi:HAE1 family hydrophobic/amphiphilic exporter-1
MNLPNLAISRHVLAAALSVVIVLLGLVGYTRIGVDRNPDVEFPTLTVSTTLAGASPLTIAQTVTQPLESRLNTIAGIDTLLSTSTVGRSAITVTFESDKDMAEALNDVQSRVSQARRDLPTEASASVVQQFDLNSRPILWLTVSAQRDTLALSALAKQVQTRLETVSGVGEIQVRGEAEAVMRVTLDETRLAALGMTYSDVRLNFGPQHLNVPGGRLKTPGLEYQVEMGFEFKTADELRMLPVARKEGRIVRLSDVAEVAETAADNRQFAQYNGTPTVALGVVKASGANPVAVIKAVRERLDSEVAPSMPADVTLEVVSDEAKPIEGIVGALKAHLIEGTLLTALVVWLFLKSVRATTIIATAIPVSLFGAVAAIYLFGYTFNSFTLLGLLLLIGVVVDDAIVVLENIYKTKETEPDLTMEQAARKGTSEVMFAVMAATLTLVCVFGPVVFLPGVLGQFFQSFAVTVVAGVLVSWFVSMTLTPMLCARYLKVHTADTGIYVYFERAFRALERRYRATLTLALTWRKSVLLLAALTLVPAALMMGSLKKEFSPQVDEGRVSVNLRLSSGMGKPALAELALKAEKRIEGISDVQGVLTTFNDGGRSGSDSISLSITLAEKREQPLPRVLEAFEKALAGEPAWRAQVSAGSGGPGGGGGGAPLQFFLQGPSYDELVLLTNKLQAELSAEPELRGIRNNLNTGLPQLNLELNREEAARVGVTAQDVAFAVSTLTGQTVLGRYTAADGERKDIVLRGTAGVAPPDLVELGNVRVRGAASALVPVSSVANISLQGASSALQRVNQQYAVTFSARPQTALGDAVAVVNKKALDLPPGYTLKFTGQAEEFRKVGGNLGLMFGMALILLYLVLASQFNSYAQPLLIMLAQPLAVVGGIGALALVDQSLNLYSMIGLILLVGLVAKNSILLVDRANQLRDQGLPVDEALRLACPQRLRPVLMTSLTVILAMLPAGMGLGAGSENNQPLAVAIIGGMLSSTLLTLVVVPAAYSLFVRARPASAAS